LDDVAELCPTCKQKIISIGRSANVQIKPGNMRSLKSVYQKQNTLKKFLESEHFFHIATIDGTVALIANFGEFLCFVFCVLWLPMPPSLINFHSATSKPV
tara:strand:- start:18206 stop:18505 length:300 start_codon:yes stop_codon:yes gene_type:complete